MQIDVEFLCVEARESTPLLALLQHMNRFECANSLVLSAALITLCINRRMPTTILDIPVTSCQVTTCDRKILPFRALCLFTRGNGKINTVKLCSRTRAQANGCLLAYSWQPGTPFCSCMSKQSACLSMLFTSHHFQGSPQPRRWLFLCPQPLLPSTQPPAAETLCECGWCSEKGRGWMVQEKAIHIAGHCRSVWRCTHLCKSLNSIL